jgi:hypothetical protein
MKANSRICVGPSGGVSSDTTHFGPPAADSFVCSRPLRGEGVSALPYSREFPPAGKSMVRGSAGPPAGPAKESGNRQPCFFVCVKVSWG